MTFQQTTEEALAEDDFNFVPFETQIEQEEAGVPEVETTKSRTPLKVSLTNGRFTLVPKEFQFPSLTFQNLVTMWFCGDKGKTIPPYRFLSASDLRHVKNGRMKLSMMKKMIGYVK